MAITGLHIGQVVHLDGIDWKIGVFLQGGSVVLDAVDGSESVTVPLPRPRTINYTGRCLADDDNG